MSDILWDEAGKWVRDNNGNRCSVAYFGSKTEAEKALKSLHNCEDCINCSDCSNCSNCSYCSYCSNCSYCSYCSNCSGCSYCSNCSGCSNCSNCSRCSYCSYCSYCSGCFNCSGCSGCSDGKGVNGRTDQGRPFVPVIKDIDRVIYAAASAPKALEMGDWHTCETTHCRAGWVVHKAGAAGYALEKFFNTELAAMLIYRESGAPINPARFYDSNEDTLADMKARAGV